MLQELTVALGQVEKCFQLRCTPPDPPPRVNANVFETTDCQLGFSMPTNSTYDS